MEYRSCDELENIGRAGAVSYEEFIGKTRIKKCRVLSSYWLCTEATKDGIAEHLNQDGFWESWITRWISANVKPNSVCIDGGATYGYYTFFLAQHGCKVFSIEANPKLIPLLEYSNYLNGTHDRVTIINRAIADESGKQIRLGYSDSIGGTSVNMSDRYGSICIDSLTLDELLMFEKKIDFIKLDISASEELAIQGMRKIMQVNPACVCIFEFAPAYYDNRGRKFFDRLSDQFSISCITEDGSEVPVYSYSFFDSLEKPWVMLVLKNREANESTNELISFLRNLS